MKTSIARIKVKYKIIVLYVSDIFSPHQNEPIPDNKENGKEDNKTDKRIFQEVSRKVIHIQYIPELLHNRYISLYLQDETFRRQTLGANQR
jgi:HD superfamily phosphohydrolase YqeK